jgi:hypothetical protein
MGQGDALLCTDDFKLAPATNPLNGWKEKAKALAKLADRPLECEHACAPLYSAITASVIEMRSSCESACANAEDLTGARIDVRDSAVLLKGTVEKPEQLLLISSRERGEREVVRRQERQLLVYEGGHVTSSASMNYDARSVNSYVLTWNDDRSRVQAMTWVNFDGGKVNTITRSEAKPEHAALTHAPRLIE